MRLLALLCLLLPLAAQASLYKCLDNTGRVTYTNAACDKAGLKQAKLIPPPPPPAIDSPKARLPQSAKPATDKPAEPLANKEVATAKLVLNKSQAPDSGNCTKLNAQIGQVMDEMDEARRAGNTAPQAAWNANLSRMQAEKNRLGCF